MQKKTFRSAIFKKKVALEAVREIETINEIAQKYAVHPIQVRQWKKELLDNAEMAFEKRKNNNNNYEAKEAKLHEQIGRLSVENDWLKKKLGI
jgi:transposase-like protein